MSEFIAIELHVYVFLQPNVTNLITMQTLKMHQKCIDIATGYLPFANIQSIGKILAL